MIKFRGKDTNYSVNKRHPPLKIVNRLHFLSFLQLFVHKMGGDEKSGVKKYSFSCWNLERIL